MIYRCRKCDYEESRGVLPGVVCGLLLLGQMAVAAALVVLVRRYFRSYGATAAEVPVAEVPVSQVPVPESATEFTWWTLASIPLTILVGFIALFIAAMILNAIMEFVEWLVFSCRRCPNCGARCWSWGFTRGFGL